MKSYKKRLEQLNKIMEIQGQNGNWNYDPYMHGLYNGLNLAHSIMTDIEPEYREPPHRWLYPTKHWWEFWK